MNYYYVSDECISCGKCSKVCPVGAPTFDGVKYSIDADECLGCGTCSEACPQGAIYPDDYVAPAIEKIPGVRNENTDILVIGAGPAGLACAARLGEQGYSVTVIDKAKKVGGAGVHATFYKAFDTKWELDAGGTRYMDDYVRAAMTCTKYQLDYSLMRNGFEANTEFFDWFCTWGEAENVFRLMDAPKGKAVMMKRPTGEYMVNKLALHCKENGVSIRSLTAAKHLILEGGKVTGVLAEDPQGEIAFHTRAVLIATGNMAQAPDLADFLPEYADAVPIRNAHRSPQATGDGVRMLRQAGIAVDFKNVSPHYLGAMPPSFDNALFKQGMRPEGLRVNSRGERYVSEGADRFDAVDVLLKQPGCISFNVFDSKILNMEIQPIIKITAQNALMIEEALPTPGKPMQYVDLMGLPVFVDPVTGKVKGFDMGGMDDDADKGMMAAPAVLDAAKLQKYADTLGGIVCAADTIEELAAQMGVDPDVFKVTVERYNTLCHKGNDTDFGKYPRYMIPIEEGPFYAIKCFLSSDGVFGGVFIDNGCRVTDGSNVIPGIYAAGDLTSGNYIKENSHRTEMINDFTWAHASGFLAAKSMVKDMAEGVI